MSDELPAEDEQPLNWLLPEGFFIDSPSISDGEGWTPMEFVAAVKCIMPNGEAGIVYCITPGLSPWEAVGMADSLEDRIRHPEYHFIDDGDDD